MFKRIFLFLLTNLAVLVVITILLSIFDIQSYLNQYGLDYKNLLIYALIIGFTGSIISLFSSKSVAINSLNVQLIKNPLNQSEAWLIDKVKDLSSQMKTGMPDVGIYESPEPNAFATGWNKDSALLAVSSGLLAVMDKKEVEGVLGHEVSHISNGDMVTLTLIQGVVNTFVIFFSQVAAIIVATLFRRNNQSVDSNSESNTGNIGANTGIAYYGIQTIFQLLFGILATIIVMWFSRHREYRADAGSAQYVGKEKMIDALKRLDEVTNKSPEDNRAPSLDTMKISAPSKLLVLFSSHPPINERIKALENS